jgi:hypothetical protein
MRLDIPQLKKNSDRAEFSSGRSEEGLASKAAGTPSDDAATINFW